MNVNKKVNIKDCIKIIPLISLILTSSLSLTGCFDKREIDELAYTTALGIDKGKTNELSVTMQFESLSAGGGGESSSSSQGEQSKTDVISIECPTLSSSFTVANSFLSKQVNVTHTKIIAISEDLAKEGLSKYIHALRRGSSFRPGMFVTIIKGSTKEFLESIKPKLDINTTRFYEKIFKVKYTGFTPNTQFHDFYYNSENLGCQTVATLASINKFENNESSSRSSNSNSSSFFEESAIPMPNDFVAGNIPRSGDIKAELMGMAAFFGDRMVGELNGADTSYYLMVTGKYKNGYWNIPDPKNKGMYVVLDIKQSRFPINKVSFIGENPFIYSKISLEADFLSISSNENYEEDWITFEKHCQYYIEKGINDFLGKTCKELKSDICGFGEFYRKNLLTWNDWESINWSQKYPNSTFKVDVSFKVRRPQLIIRSKSPVVKNSDEEEIANADNN